MNRAYSLLEVRSVDDDKRIIEGVATTPKLARDGMIIETEGIGFKLPIPFLYRHKSEFPLGNVVAANVSKDGIHVRIQVGPPGVAEYIDEAWRVIKAGVVRGLSIGWSTVEEHFDKAINGFRITKSEWLELSAVPVPADVNATIHSVRSIDTEIIAALGTKDNRGVVRLGATRNLPGVSGQPKGIPMTIQEQITQFENKRAASEARMSAIMTKAGDAGSTLDATEQEEYDTLETEVRSVDAHLVRLKAHEQRLIQTAKPVTKENTSTTEKASDTRGGIITVRSNLPKGTTFARCVMALANAGIPGTAGKREAAELAKSWWPDAPEVELILRAAVAAGTTTNATWAAPLVPAAQQMQSEMLELLRPATLVGRIPGLRRVPFNVNVPAQTGGGTYGWVGETQAKPVSALAFTSVSLLFNKIAGIVVLTKELVKFSNPAAEQIVRNDMIAGIAGFIDAQFVDPAVAVNGTISPASITNGATTAAATGTTAAALRTDMRIAFASLLTANENPADFVILTSASIALNLSLLMNAMDSPEFPGIGMNGGTLLGLPVVVSQAVGARIIILKASEILLADDGPVEIDISEQASLVMDSAPQASPQTTELVSLWQRNYVGIRAEKFISYKVARSTAVYYVSNAVYSG